MSLVSDEIFYSDQDYPALLGGKSKLTGEYKFPFPLGSERENYDRVPCLLYTSPSPRDATLSRMPSSA